MRKREIRSRNTKQGRVDEWQGESPGSRPKSGREPGAATLLATERANRADGDTRKREGQTVHFDIWERLLGGVVLRVFD